MSVLTVDRLDLDDMFDLDLEVVTSGALPLASISSNQAMCPPNETCPPPQTLADSCNSYSQTGRPCKCF